MTTSGGRIWGVLSLSVFLIIFGQLLFAQDAVEEYEAGEQAFEAGEYARAVQRYRNAINRNEAYREAWVGLARAYRRLNELQPALEAVSQARRLARNDADIISLEGDIHLLRGNVEQAREAFERALELEPNNTDARIGVAELELANDRRARAVEQYQEILELDPQSRPALLSLAVLYDELGDSGAAARYIALALDYYPRDELVHEVAGDHFLSREQSDVAAEHAETAVTLNPDYGRGWDLLSRAALDRGEYDRAREAAERLVDLRPERARSWYLLGLAERSAGSYAEAVAALERAAELSPDDEVARLALESAVEAAFDLDDEVRERIAEYRFERGSSLVEDNLFIQAVTEYRRGLSLYPFSRDGRYDLAVLQRRRGFPAKFVEELHVLESLGFDDREISDGISTYESVLADSVSRIWNIDQFDLPRDRMTFGLFYTDPPRSGARPEANRYVTEYIRHRLLGVEKIETEGSVRPARSEEAAFSRAREVGVDYYLLVRFSENDRSIELSVDLRHGPTGTRIARLTAVRSGARRIQRAVSSVSARMETDIPARGRVVERRGNRIVVNLGAADGVEAEDELLIARRDRIATAADRIGYAYDEQELVGRMEVSETDDLLLEGEFTTQGFFDLVETGDTVLQTLDGRVEAIEERPAFSPLYFRIREVRGDSQN